MYNVYFYDFIMITIILHLCTLKTPFLMYKNIKIWVYLNVD